MVVIFSIESDSSSHEVMDWLDFLDEKFYVIYPNNFNNKIVELISYLENGNKPSFWFRKWDKSYFDEEYKNTETFKLIEYIYHLTKDFCFWLNNPYDCDSNNKLTQHIYANRVGLNVPSLNILNKKEQLESLVLDSSNQFITKSFGSQIMQNDSDGNTLFAFTNIIDNELINKSADSFFPSLIQEYIEKEFEIRTFYLDGEFYSMAIFSQDNEKTKIDFRHYDNKIPNRLEPISLPKDIENKLKVFIKQINTNCGSFDLIQSISGDLYFIECNALGQFGMVSKPCNYMLEKRIALLLKEKSEPSSQEISIAKTIDIANEDSLCTINMNCIETVGADACYYSTFYESNYAIVKDLNKPIDLLG